MIYVHACGNNKGRTHYLRYQECHLVFCGMWRWSGCDICHSRFILPLSRLGDISFLHKHFVCNPLGTSSLVAQLSMPGKGVTLAQHLCFYTYHVQLIAKYFPLYFPIVSIICSLFSIPSAFFIQLSQFFEYWKDLYSYSPIETRNAPSKIQILPKFCRNAYNLVIALYNP